MTTLPMVKKIAAKYGATVENISSYREWQFDFKLPKGKYWNANGLQVIYVHSFKGEAKYKGEMFDGAIRQMNYGVS